MWWMWLMHLAYRNSGWDFCLKFTVELLKKSLKKALLLNSYAQTAQGLWSGDCWWAYSLSLWSNCELSVWKMEILMEIKIRELNVKRATMFTAQNLCHWAHGMFARVHSARVKISYYLYFVLVWLTTVPARSCHCIIKDYWRVQCSVVLSCNIKDLGQFSAL